ncbi:MAG TPA: MerR family transcriptional regulator [Caulobacter sp.]|nr:MerR family transcriptional regulator [Caulobacter sp.]
MAGRRFGLTPRAIRHYEEHALVRPSRDSRGRRTFDDVQCARLELIAALRAADVPLREIDRLLATPDPQRARVLAQAVLEQRLRQIQASQALVVSALDWLKTFEGLPEHPVARSTL